MPSISAYMRHIFVLPVQKRFEKKKINSFSTHRLFLKTALEHSRFLTGEDRPLVLFEVGTGGESSRLFSEEIETSGTTTLVAFENDPKWISEYEERFPDSNRRRIVLVPADSEWSENIERELSLLPENAFVLGFIDSAPWQSRADALMALKNRADIVLVHDVDYFPTNEIFGKELAPIKRPRNTSKNPVRMSSASLGSRTYSDVFLFWMELFPEFGGYFTGPPTLMGSNTVDVTKFPLPPGTILQSSSSTAPSVAR